MRKMFVVISLVMMFLLLIACAPKPLTDEELEAELSQLPAEELDKVIADAESGSGAIAGQAIKSSPQVAKASRTQIVEVGNKVKLKSKLFSCVNSPGLLHLWKGENSGKDSVGGADLTLTGATYGEGKVDQSFYFDGVDDYATATVNLAAEGLANKISVEMWIRPEVIPHSQLLALIGDGFPIGINPEGDVTISTSFSTNSEDLESLGTLSLNKWNHILAIYNGNSLRLYVNGIGSEKPITEPIKFSKNKIILDYSAMMGSSDSLKIKIDELAIYNEDVSNCMQQYACGNGKTDIGEQCDDGNKLEDDFCTSKCTFTSKVQKIKVLVVKTCNTDGTICSEDLQKNNIQTALNGANNVYARSGSKIRFVIDPATSFDFVKDDLIASRNLLYKSVSEIEQLTTKDLNGDGKFDDNDANILYDGEATGKARTDFSLKYPNSLVVFALAVQHTKPKYDYSTGHWQVNSAKGGFSACKGAYVAMPPSFGGDNGNLLAHESGHYFCNPHTFSSDPSTINEAATTIQDNILSKKLDPNGDTAIKNIFDGDFDNGILDTSADPGAKLFESVYGNVCDPDLSKKIGVPVSLGPLGSKTYVFQPDRTNIMSYFKGCFPDLAHFSPGQVMKHYKALETHRNNLLATSGYTPIQVNLFKASLPEVVKILENEEEFERDIELLKAFKGKKLIVQPVCGNNKQEAGEQCDDGNTVSGDDCSSTCQNECGNGKLDEGEECDDGNSVGYNDGGPDGCSGVCRIYQGWTCNNIPMPSKCTKQAQEVKLQCVNPSSGLVSWWSGDNNANDLVGGKNGVLKGGTTFSQGKVGQAFKFDGVDDYVEIVDDPSFNQATFTVAAWVKPDIYTSHAIISKKDSWSLRVNKDYSVAGDLKVGRIYLGVRNADLYTDVHSQAIITTGNWYHVAVTYDAQADMVKIYVNGQEVQKTISKSTPTLTTPKDNAEPLHIGTGVFGESLYRFKGLIDEVAFWNRALTAAEIQSIYAADAAGMCK